MRASHSLGALRGGAFAQLVGALLVGLVATTSGAPTVRAQPSSDGFDDFDTPRSSGSLAPDRGHEANLVRSRSPIETKLKTVFKTGGDFFDRGQSRAIEARLGGPSNRAEEGGGLPTADR